MGCLQVGVALVPGVSRSVALQRVGLGEEVGGKRRLESPATLAFVDGTFVDVVAEEDDDVGPVGGEVPVGGVVASVPRLTRRRGDVELADRPTALRRCLRSPGAADPPSALEPVAVFAAGGETVDDDVDRVPELRNRQCRTAPFHGCEVRVAGDLPLDLVGSLLDRRVVRILGRCRRHTPGHLGDGLTPERGADAEHTGGTTQGEEASSREAGVIIRWPIDGPTVARSRRTSRRMVGG
jgi:hypothetical protein